METGKKNILSLCMIVKNEEKSLKNCLSKVVSFVDEIIIVDTGSTDNTKKIASEFTDNIYDFQWCNDFSKARNYSISKASGEWILILDADEVVTDFFRYSIDEFINNTLNENKVGRIKRINIMEDSFESKKYTEWVNRLFNKNNFYYEGIIHEQIISKDGQNYETEQLDITADHIGYTKEVLNRTNKIKRNIDMLKSAVSLNPEDPYLYYQLGKSYYMLKDYKTADLYFEKALTFELNYYLEYVSDLVETYGYSLINSRRYSDALIIENASEIYTNNPDFQFVMGLVYMNNAMFEKAVQSFLKCTKFPCGKVEGVTSFSAYYNIGVIYDVLGVKDKALQYYRMCGKYEPALKRIKAQLN
ncbi:glycosyl transferase [Clostridium carboxidivorans P7]|uniref:Glycosyl transferase family 2 n=1 Tax=Clostridium carboxidivorans P7 TaxID=536227 RepID=C6PPH0_9CLOT|nr:glycosyltransferase family 2 protein [Clostridium carboxidivorans]AKN33932.1 glycosyl transferase [Clostridium carboxidivorans P7]EET88864.1 glycosyl transferase family 2 [Clostridium carboxidivorans P7]EFG88194.1 glycosyltransferase, group 2 family protein [Clostridium carboxidivorans P7]